MLDAETRLVSEWAEASMIVAFAVGVSVAAIVVALLAADFARRAHRAVVLLAGVVLVAVCALHLVPEALEHGAAGGMALALGLLVGGVLEGGGRLVLRRGGTAGSHVVAQVALLALALHSTVDGAIYAVASSHDHTSGLLVGPGLILHEAPEGVVALFLALQTRWTRAQAVAAAVCASSLTTPVGWVIGTAAGAAAHEQIDMLFAASAGLLSYSGARLLISGLSKPKTASESPR